MIVVVVTIAVAAVVSKAIDINMCETAVVSGAIAVAPVATHWGVCKPAV